MKCKTEDCSNDRRSGRCYCHKCLKRQQRSRDKMKAAYVALRDNAKRRRKPFELTFSEFESFAIRTQYIVNRGKKAESWHIDRIDESKGYTIENIQVLTNSENVKKYVRFWERTQKGVTFQTVTVRPYENKECPF